MESQQLRSNLLLLLAAGIWGFAFVAQKTSMDYIGPFSFNGIRFALGSLSLLPLIFWMDKRAKRQNVQLDKDAQPRSLSWKPVLKAGFLVGLILFAGSSLQQIGLIYTTAGKAAFITGLYIVIVPILGLYLKQRLNMNIALGVMLAAVGLYFLSITASFTISLGDFLELIGAFFWSVHILMIDRLSQKVDVLKLSLVQMVTCSLLSLITAIAIEVITWSSIVDAMIPLIYGGVFSAGIAYTLQIVGQKDAKPAQAAIILSMEAVFAAIGGYMLLHEHLSTRGLLGCSLMLLGMLLPQLPKLKLSLKS